MKRRHFLQLTGASLVIWHTANATETAKENNKKKKIVWIILRGAMDSLHTVVPIFDAHLMEHRAALINPIKDQLLTLDRGFGLHPELSFFHDLFKVNQLSPVIAVATPYRERSHFDAQDLLESGLKPVNQSNGWLARAVSEYQSEGLALSQSTPISLRGNNNIHSWYPSSLPEANSDLYNRLAGLYANDAALKQRLSEALGTQAMVGDMADIRSPKLTELATACAKLLREDATLSCAMMEMGGWDTHNNLTSRLKNQFKELNAGLKALHTGLGETWQDTLVIIATEFGRTVAMNGTNGSDHGTASALFLAGGSLANSSPAGGKILGDWPGLAPEQLYQGRDLQPTSNTFTWIRNAMQQHWQLTNAQMTRIFPTAS